MPKIYSFNDFIKHLYGKDESVFTCVVGKNETGKTDFNLLQFERIHDLGISENFGTNMRTVKADFDIAFIEDFQTLERTCRMLNPDPKNKGMKKFFYFMSEIGKALPRDESWRNTKFIGKLQTVRKYGLCMLTDAIDRVDGRVLHPRFFAGLFEKPFKRNKKFAIYDDWGTGKRYKFTDIPKTRIEYDTYETANFYMEPQNQEGELHIPLNREHEIVFQYLDNDCSWKKAGIDTQTGKRSMVKVLKFYRAHYLREVQEQYKDKPIPEAIEET